METTQAHPKVFLMLSGDARHLLAAGQVGTVADEALVLPGQRVGYTMAMTEAVSQISLEDLDVLAYYVARFSTPPGK